MKRTSTSVFSASVLVIALNFLSFAGLAQESQPPKVEPIKPESAYWRASRVRDENRLETKTENEIAAMQYYLHLGDFSTKMTAMREIVRTVLENTVPGHPKFAQYSHADAHGSAFVKIAKTNPFEWIRGEVKLDTVDKKDVRPYFARRQPDFVFIQTELNYATGRTLDATRQTEVESIIRDYVAARTNPKTKMVFVVMPEVQMAKHHFAGRDKNGQNTYKDYTEEDYRRHLQAIDAEMVRLAVKYGITMAPLPQAYSLLRRAGRDVRAPENAGDQGHPSPRDAYLFACSAVYSAYVQEESQRPGLIPAATIFDPINYAIELNTKKMHGIAKSRGTVYEEPAFITMTDEDQTAINQAAWQALVEFRARVADTMKTKKGE